MFMLLAFKFGNVFGTSFERSFFGVYRTSIEQGGQFRVLSHGTTVHGAMRVANEDGSLYTGPADPLTYYHKQGSLAETLNLLPANSAGRDIAIVGLGTGAQACNGSAGDRFTFFEIDQLVVKIALDKSKFRFMSECAPKAKIVLGDARLTLTEQPATYDYLMLDAFSSDSIPVHLLTREALQLYMQRLKENGLLVIHISNRNLELQSVIAALAQDAGLSIKAIPVKPIASGFANKFPAAVAVLAKKPETLNVFTQQNGWLNPPTNNVAVWTDDYSNIISALWRNFF